MQPRLIGGGIFQLSAASRQCRSSGSQLPAPITQLGLQGASRCTIPIAILDRIAVAVLELPN
ncbi:GD18501 [Drosophila simulans]|uniref:GD18501 n=1 Tax=Drosophila simulans TaxID=7240 RepID=B4QZ96_DROSI|nr:GD18501 [Drosophila simulans]